MQNELAKALEGTPYLDKILSKFRLTNKIWKFTASQSEFIEVCIRESYVGGRVDTLHAVVKTYPSNTESK